MIDIKVEVYNIAEVISSLRKVESKISDKVTKKALKDAGVKIVKPKLKNYAQTMIAGKMGRFIGSHLKVNANRKNRLGNYSIEVLVNPNVSQAKTKTLKSGKTKTTPGMQYVNKAGEATYIPFAIEFGHAAPYQSGSGNKVAKEIPFMRNATEASRNEVIKFFGDAVTAALRDENG